MNNGAFNKIIQLGQLETVDNGGFKLSFSILKTSEIFKGHFPQQPILPGVIMIELTMRAAESAIGNKLRLVAAGNFKFLKMVDPSLIETAEMQLTVSVIERGWRVKAEIIFQGEIYFKADASYEQH